MKPRMPSASCWLRSRFWFAKPEVNPFVDENELCVVGNATSTTEREESCACPLQTWASSLSTLPSSSKAIAQAVVEVTAKMQRSVRTATNIAPHIANDGRRVNRKCCAKQKRLPKQPLCVIAVA